MSYTRFNESSMKLKTSKEILKTKLFSTNAMSTNTVPESNRLKEVRVQLGYSDSNSNSNSNSNTFSTVTLMAIMATMATTTTIATVTKFCQLLMLLRM